MRTMDSRWPNNNAAHYTDAGERDEALVRKCDGLSEYPNLTSYIGTVRVVIAQSTAIIPKLALVLSSLQSLHTLQVCHAHRQMTTAIKNGFQGVVLPGIRTLIIPKNGHEILKCCPQVTKVWCNNGDGSELVTVTVDSLLTHRSRWTTQAMGYEGVWAKRAGSKISFENLQKKL